ncbi:MAG: hypothetical protein ACXVB1_00030 [Pseudobdellovibrionaceae bacterium]
MTRGQCTNIISGKSFEVNETNKLNGKTWWEMRPAMIQVPASTWASLKKFIIKTCKKYDSCQKEVPTWERTIGNVDGALDLKKP